MSPLTNPPLPLPGAAGNLLTSNGANWISATPATGGTTPPPTSGDSQFNSVVALLLHFDGANNTSVFTDVKSHPVTVNGNAKISTDQFKFGNSSGYFDGTGDYLSLPVEADFQFGSGDFTWECWCRPALVNPSAPMTILGNAQGSSAGNAGLFLVVQGSRFLFRHWVNGSTNATSSQTISSNSWYHVAAVKTGTALKLFVDGVQGTDGSTSLANQDNQFRVGTTTGNAGYATDFSGYLDELRLSKAVRYTANFSPPSEAFPNS